jgi:hypothetical protein
MLLLTLFAATPFFSPYRTSMTLAAETTDMLDINTATVDQLNALPGIGDAYSEKSIKGGPYAGTGELVQKKIIPQATYDEIKERIFAQHTSPVPEAQRKESVREATNGGFSHVGH